MNKPDGKDVKLVQPLNVCANIYGIPVTLVVNENRLSGRDAKFEQPLNMPMNIDVPPLVKLPSNPDGTDVNPVHPSKVWSNIVLAPATEFPPKLNNPVGILVNPVHPENVAPNKPSAPDVMRENKLDGIAFAPVNPVHP